MSQVHVRNNVQAVRAVDKLVEYRTAHYASHSEAARYFTNTPARVRFRFANPIICRLVSGHKVMSVAASDTFDFTPGDVMFVPPGLDIDIDLSVARVDAPIECDCIEIENERVDSVLGRLNETMTRGGNPVATSLDWTAFSVLRGSEADELDLPNLMRLFQTERDVFSDLRIDTKIDELLLRLLQLRGRSLLVSNFGSDDSGIAVAASLIRDNLHRHVPISELARAAATSESSVNRQFKKFFGTTPARFANKVRIAEAKRQLRKSAIPIETIAFELGFSDASHFGRTFRRTTGETPAEYRKRRQHPPAGLV